MNDGPLTRADLETTDLLHVLAELKLKPSDAPLVWLAELLRAELNKNASPTGKAQLAGQLLAVLKELGASPQARGGPDMANDVLDSFRRS